jgi:hypothetical protein
MQPLCVKCKNITQKQGKNLSMDLFLCHMCHWLGTTGLKLSASRLYAVTYTCQLTCLCFFFLSVCFESRDQRT